MINNLQYSIIVIDFVTEETMFVIGTGLLWDIDTMLEYYPSVAYMRQELLDINPSFLIHENTIESKIFITMEDACVYLETIDITTVSKFDSSDLTAVSNFLQLPIQIVIFVTTEVEEDLPEE